MGDLSLGGQADFVQEGKSGREGAGGAKRTPCALLQPRLFIEDFRGPMLRRFASAGRKRAGIGDLRETDRERLCACCSASMQVLRCAWLGHASTRRPIGSGSDLAAQPTEPGAEIPAILVTCCMPGVTQSLKIQDQAVGRRGGNCFEIADCLRIRLVPSLQCRRGRRRRERGIPPSAGLCWSGLPAGRKISASLWAAPSSKPPWLQSSLHPRTFRAKLIGTKTLVEKKPHFDLRKMPSPPARSARLRRPRARSALPKAGRLRLVFSWPPHTLQSAPGCHFDVPSQICGSFRMTAGASRVKV